MTSRNIAESVSSVSSEESSEQESQPPAAKRPYRPISPSSFRSPQRVASGRVNLNDEESGEDLPVPPGNFSVIPMRAIPGGRSTVPTTPATPAEIARTEPTTPIVSIHDPIYTLLRPRMIKYARNQSVAARLLLAIELLPAVARLFNRYEPIDVVSAFNLSFVSNAELRILNDPFNNAVVWRDTFRESFPTFIEEYVGDMLPDFYDVPREAREQVERWKREQGSEEFGIHSRMIPRPEPIHGTVRQWRHYYYLVYDLFEEMARLTVVAFRKAPTGEWREYFSRRINEVTMMQTIDRPEKAIFVAPEQFGIGGDIYDIAVSTFKPLSNDANRFSNIVRWYEVFDWHEFYWDETAFSPESSIVQSKFDLLKRSDKSFDDHLRYQVGWAPEQFLRTRAVLNVGGYQWWSYAIGLDDIMFEPSSRDDLEEQKITAIENLSLLRREIAAKTTELNQLIRGERMRTKRAREQAFQEQLEIEVLSSPLGSAADLNALEKLGTDGSDARQLQLQEELVDLHQRQRNVNRDFSMIEKMLDEKHATILQFAVFATADVDNAIREAPLRAENFVLLEERITTRESTTERIAVEASIVEPMTPRAIEFSDGEEGTNVEEAVEVLNTFVPAPLDRRFTFQPKFTLLLTHTLRYFTGWISTSNEDFDDLMVLEYYAQFDYEDFTTNGIIEKDYVANFIIWLIQKHQNHRRRRSKSPNVHFVGTDPLQEAEQAHAYAVTRIDNIVQKRAFPFLREFVSETD